MITKYFLNDISEAKTAKRACQKAWSVNTSNKVLLGITQGIGNLIMATPLIRALNSMKMKVDILSIEGAFNHDSEKVFVGMPDVKVLTPEELKGRIYLIGLQSAWPCPGLENYVAQVRGAGNIHQLWKDGIPVHEVEQNMSLAYWLKYTGDIPPLYCNYNEKPKFHHKKTVGVHITRKYKHQHYANRAIKDPLKIGEELWKHGCKVVVFGHEGCVTDEDKEKYEYLNFYDGMDLPDTAGYIRELDCMVNEDSGIMHVTAAMDTPQVAVFGPTSEVKNSPWSKKAMIIRKTMECAPCQYTDKALTCARNECMDIDTEYIVERVTKKGGWRWERKNCQDVALCNGV
jgi:ADP-heptose:LPS heptosyltransferase